MDEALTNRINNLMDMTLQRLETEVQSAPPEVMQHTAMSVFNLYSLKETLKNAATRSMLEEKAIKQVVDNLRKGNGGVSGNVKLP